MAQFSFYQKSSSSWKCVCVLRNGNDGGAQWPFQGSPPILLFASAGLQEASSVATSILSLCGMSCPSPHLVISCRVSHGER